MDAQHQFRAGNNALKCQDFERAIRLYRQVVSTNPDFGPAHVNMAYALATVGKLHDALSQLEEASRVAPNFAPIWNNRGNLFARMSRDAEAVESYQRAFQVDPNYSDALNNCSAALCRLNSPEEALECSERALAIQPENAGYLNQKGVALAELNRFDEAIAVFEGAVALDPALSKGMANIAAMYRLTGLPNEALPWAQRAANCEPARAENWYNLSLVQLQLGNLDEGFRNYEWRKRLEQPLGARYLNRPMWDGNAEAIDGRKLLVHAEQGLGDTIQFSRYLALAARLGAEIIFQVPRRLLGLMSSLEEPKNLIADEKETIPFDAHCPLMSLPYVLGTTLENLPASNPYLRPDPIRVARWKEQIGLQGLKIGIVWQGNRNSASDRGRSMPLELFQPISTIEGVRLISLQSDHRIAAPFPVETLGPDFDVGPDGFLDTAAALQSLDLLISVDTAVAHLAGALGRPTWLALKVGADWRWLVDRSDTPWYPKHRLFRQKTLGDWATVVHDMAAQLRQIRVLS